jgi:hypothetical protein
MISCLGGLYREIHHIKNADDPDGGFEPTLVILNHNRKGRSFMIPLACIWKYVDPMQYKDDVEATRVDWADFNRIALKARMMAEGKSENNILLLIPNRDMVKEGFENLAACQFAYAFHKGTGVLLCTSFNLAKFMQVFEISMIPQNAAQVLLWIQDRLDDLKNAAENPEKEEQYVAGEMDLFIDGNKVCTKEMTVTAADTVMHSNA